VPEIEYARNGDAHVAYRVSGAPGRVDVVMVTGALFPFEMLAEDRTALRFTSGLAALGRLVVFDKRGTGLSDRTLGSGSAEERMDDLRAVADAAEVDDAVLVGLSEGGPLALLFATTYPERVRALVLWGTFARLLDGPDYPSIVTTETADQFIDGAVKAWGTGRAARWPSCGRGRRCCRRSCCTRCTTSMATP